LVKQADAAVEQVVRAEHAHADIPAGAANGHAQSRGSTERPR
jgi:hypothetical protein